MAEVESYEEKFEHLETTVNELSDNIDELYVRERLLTVTLDKVFGPRLGVNSYLASKGVKSLERHVNKYVRMINDEVNDSGNGNMINRSMKLVRSERASYEGKNEERSDEWYIAAPRRFAPRFCRSDCCYRSYS